MTAKYSHPCDHCRRREAVGTYHVTGRERPMALCTFCITTLRPMERSVEAIRP